MKTAKLFQKTMIWILVFLFAMPMPAFSQDVQLASKKFSQAQLDQIMAPIALYPDALLAQVLMASTYPLEVVAADRWVRKNKDLKGDALTEGAAKQPWDVSVKALVPFPSVLSMMSEKLDWMQNVGDAFLVQESEILDTVQELRKKATAASNLETTDQQNVTVDKDVIYIAPRNPEVVYVPVYDPWWVYGPWWWPAYPPYVIYPYSAGFVLSPGFIWFGAGCFVGAFWGRAWGYWDWPHRRVFVNVNRTVNIYSRNINISNMKTRAWVHDPVHRRGVVYRDSVSRERFGAINRQAVENRRMYRGFEQTPGAAPRSMTGRSGLSGGGSKPALSRPDERSSPGRSAVRSGGEMGAGGRSRSSGTLSTPANSRADERPSPGRPAVRSGSESGGNPNVFTGIGQGSEVRTQRTRGSSATSGGRVGEGQVRGAEDRGERSGGEGMIRGGGDRGDRSGGGRPAAGGGGSRGRQR
jgi:hypothetical protein